MLNLDGYQQTNQIYIGTRTVVYQAIQATQGKPVIIKVLRNPHPDFNQLVQFRNQYIITRHLEHPAIVQPLALERYGNGYALVMADNSGISLWEYWQQCDHSVTDFLNIAIQLASALYYLNQQRIVHKDIKPSNILIHPETKHIKLIDFSISSLLPTEQQQLINPNVLEGTLAYISPEQTGRMNRGIDYRTDFYSLGVTFFELLSKKLPFQSNDPMELVHCHIAQTVSFPTGNEVPEVLQNIVLKLMAKNAEERYQSALGLKHDLERCQQQLETIGKITSFELGETDQSDRFIIPEKLYGRETEVQALLDAFERVANQPLGQAKGVEGRSEMILVKGFSGIGKTAVVNEVHKPIVRQRGYFIKGKFDQFNRNIPLSSFVEAFRDLMGQLLAESDTDLGIWKTKILEAVGENGQVIIEVIPELESIIGQQPPVPQLSGSAAKNRFNLLFGKFVSVFTTKEHPLVIFLDDLQWADSASLNLLKLLMNESETGYLLLLGAYRDNEVFPTHPLILTLDEIQKQDANIHTLTLTPLNQADITRLVADTLLCSEKIAAPLSELVYQKTQGNPFFATQFLKGLYQEGYIKFDHEAGYWQCNLTQIRQLALTDNVVEFMVKRLRKLPIGTQDILKLAACIGNRFNLATLAVVCQESQEEVATNLWRGLQEGLIIPESQSYKFFHGVEDEVEDIENLSVNYHFLHDRVQQAAYTLIPEQEKQSTHLKIGQLLQRNLSAEQREEKLFDILRHLNLAIDIISAPLERQKLAQLNQIAGKKARAATAYEAATSYFQVGIALLNQDCWQHQYDLTLALYTSGSEATFLNKNFAQMEQWSATVLEKAKTILDRAKVYELKILALISQNNLLEGLNLGISVLQQLGIDFPTEVQPHQVESGFEETRNLLLNREIVGLIELPVARDPHKCAAMRILAIVTTAAYKANPQLVCLITLKQVNISILHGNTPQSAYAYAFYGVLLCLMQGNIDVGYEFGQLALKLLNCDPNKIDLREVGAKTALMVYLFIYHRKHHVRETLSSLLSSYTHALEIGDFEFATYCIYRYCVHSYLIGEELTELAETMKTYALAMIQLQQQQALSLQEPYRHAVLKWLDRSDLCLITEQEYDFSQLLTQYLESSNLEAVFYLYLNELILEYSFENYARARELSVQAESYLSGSMTIAVFYFYDSLIGLSWYRTFVKPDNSLLEKVEKNLEQLEVWARHAPMNYCHKIDLIEAEKHQSLGENYRAMEIYDSAIAGAKTNKYTQEEALANELAAKFYLDWGKEKVAAGYMQEAYYCYARWGARAKTQQLESTYPQLLTPILEQRNNHNSHKTFTSTQASDTLTSIAPFLDQASVIKASRAISEEIALDTLLSKFMQIIIENAGANKGVLLLNNSKNWEIVTQCYNNSCHLSTIPLQQTDIVPLTIINTVKRTKKTLFFNNFQQNNTFITDPYFLAQKPKSLLCCPILKQGKLIGILYLENNLTTEAFTIERLEIFNLLTAQAAISIENARLYQHLEAKVEQRTQHLQQTLEKLQQTQAQLIHTEKMSSLGEMVGGVAHEINNPISFISGNITHAREYFQDLLELLNLYQEGSPHSSSAIQEKLEEIDLEFLCDDLEKLLNSMETGSKRISNIIRGLRNFSRLDESKTKEVDIHEGLDNTLMILQHRLKVNSSGVEVAVFKSYGKLPLVNCYANQLNQVFMHIISNAIDAVTSLGTENFPQIAIATQMKEEQTITISIADNGIGMNENVCQRIFEPFFTTKPVGKGTGLGLFISYQIITEQHGGRLECISQAGKGTEFIIDIPV